MKWLQSTFATRFNRLRNERGHVFQGRYKSILIGEDRPLVGLVDYIHLNPVRAGICTLEELKNYALSSYPKFFKRKIPDGLCRGDFLGTLELPDSLAGMRRYREHLALSEAKDPDEREKLSQRYCRGWFIGPSQQKKELAKELTKQNPTVDWEGADLQELKEQQWEELLLTELKQLKKTADSIKADAKGAEWKIAIARSLRKQCTANNRWIAERLNMGHPSRVSNLISNKS